MYITAQGCRLRNDLYCVEWDAKLYYTIPYHKNSKRKWSTPLKLVCLSVAALSKSTSMRERESTSKNSDRGIPEETAFRAPRCHFVYRLWLVVQSGVLLSFWCCRFYTWLVALMGILSAIGCKDCYVTCHFNCCVLHQWTCIHRGPIKGVTLILR